MNQIQQLSWFINELLCQATITSFFFFSDTVETSTNSHLSTTANSLQWPLFWQTSIYKLLLKPLYNGHFLLSPRTAQLRRGPTVLVHPFQRPLKNQIVTTADSSITDAVINNISILETI